MKDAECGSRRGNDGSSDAHAGDACCSLEIRFIGWTVKQRIKSSCLHRSEMEIRVDLRGGRSEGSVSDLKQPCVSLRLLQHDEISLIAARVAVM